MTSDTAQFPINGGSYPPFGVITDVNHGSYIIIATWIFATISVLFVAVRVLLRAWRSRRFGLDNALIVGALVFAIGQSISASESVQYGLGQHFNVLSEDSIQSYYRAKLASDILSVFVFVLSKLSLIVLIANLSPSNTISLLVKCFTVVTILWGISNVLSSSLQCGASVPMRSRSETCVNEVSLSSALPDESNVSRKLFFFATESSTS
ncbi:hypothetical protein F5X98DRAFT_379624 [Xylaria grammica]|nr:hypothetical protein F5X98DRAFT_379624 [Xylaria grammica]